MQYWFFPVGVVLLIAAVWVSNAAAREGWDGMACVAFGAVGVLLIAAGVGMEMFNNYEEKRRMRR